MELVAGQILRSFEPAFEPRALGVGAFASARLGFGATRSRTRECRLVAHRLPFGVAELTSPPIDLFAPKRHERLERIALFHRRSSQAMPESNIAGRAWLSERANPRSSMSGAKRPPDQLDRARATVRHELFGGTGAVHVWDLGATTPPFTAVLYCELDPGGRVGDHVQQADHEVVVVVSGEAVLYVNGAAKACLEGDAVAVPLGARLAIDNASMETPVRYVIVKARRE